METSGKTNPKQTQPEKGIIPLWAWFNEVLIEPILLGFTIVLLFSRLQSLVSDSPNLITFLQRLATDMNNNVWVYVIFVILFFLWAILKAKRIKWEHDQEKERTTKLENLLNGNFEKLSTKIGELVEEMRKDREANNDNKPSSKL